LLFSLYGDEGLWLVECLASKPHRASPYAPFAKRLLLHFHPALLEHSHDQLSCTAGPGREESQ
jgi:hypothetical protein